MLFKSLWFLLRVGLMFLVTAVFAGLFMSAFNHFFMTRQIDFFEAWALLVMVGVVRFVWNFEQLV